jgi:DNA-binding LytR/AlgR family response regulator
MLKIVILDDEPLAHQVLLHHLAAWPDVQVVAQCFSAAEAMAVLAQQQVDLLLLDIQLPVLTGLEMLRLLAQPPQVVMISAYAEHALTGFALDVADYLLKPVSAERLSQALTKVRRRLLLNAPFAESQAAPQEAASSRIASPHARSDYLVLKVERERRRFELASICCFESYGNYVKVWQGDRMTLVNSTLKQLRAELEPAAFVQVHKSYLVAVRHVISRDSHQLQLSNHMLIKIGDAYKAQARLLLGLR